MSDAGGRKLAAYVTLRDPKFRLVTFAAGDVPPAWAQALITNPKAWASTDESASTPEGGPTQPEGSQEDAPPAADDQAPADTQTGPLPLRKATEGELAEPPKRGAGSGKDAWAAFAESKGITVTDGMSRDDIIAAIEAAE